MPIAPELALLNPEQRAAAEAVRGPVCIVAGAGTGKTRTITHRIAHQVASGVADPPQILAVTFTDKAAAELRQRLHSLGLPAPIRAATFHAAAWAQLRWFWSRIDEGPLPEVLPSKLRLLIPLARRTRTEAKDLAAEIEWAKARGLTPDAYAGAAAERKAPLPAEQMAAVYAEYERRKADERLIDYDDMLLRTTAMLHDHPQIAAEVQDRYRHVTVDEFQDVNPSQFALLRAWLGDGDNVCVVGDDDQTIYSFTGATSDYLTRFTTHFPTATQVTLTRNYRSTPQILTLANKVLWTKPEGKRKVLLPTSDGGPAPSFVEHDDHDAEVKAVVAAIGEHMADGTPLGEIAVLYRINSQSELFEAALNSARIPYVVPGAGGFYDRQEIRQALAVLAAAVDRPDPVPLGLEDTTPATPPTLVDRVRSALRGQMQFNDRVEPSGQAARERWHNLSVLLELAERESAATPELTMGDLVERLRARAAAGADAAGDTGAVTLSTLHRAKGREFDAVFLVAAEEGLLPISHAKTDPEVEEERRLLYVGVTRARRHLTISWARERPGYGGKIVARRPSRLLYNLGDGAPQTVTPLPKKSGKAKTKVVVEGPVAERLRTWRKARAVDDDVPAFVVFNDKTLAELARLQPRTRSDLLRVSGIGPAKVERYGDDLLELLGSE
jgi:DNA helicase-2/ATP-dependent DNA helicase PcrA